MTPAPTPSILAPDAVDAVLVRVLGADDLAALSPAARGEVDAYVRQVLTACRHAAAVPGVVVPGDWITTRSRLGSRVAAFPILPPAVLSPTASSGRVLDRAGLLRTALVSTCVDALDVARRPFPLGSPSSARRPERAPEPTGKAPASDGVSWVRDRDAVTTLAALVSNPTRTQIRGKDSAEVSILFESQEDAATVATMLAATPDALPSGEYAVRLRSYRARHLLSNVSGDVPGRASEIREALSSTASRRAAQQGSPTRRAVKGAAA